MSKGSSVVNGAYWVGSGIITGLSWGGYVVKKVTIDTITYTANTTVEFLKKGIALRHAIPALVYDPELKRAVNGMSSLLFHVTTTMALYYMNNKIYSYFQQGFSRDEAWHAPSSLLFGLATLANFGMNCYVKKRSVEATMIMIPLLSFAPADFNKHKHLGTSARCIQEQCNTLRFIKGITIRTPVIDVLSSQIEGLIRYVPHYGAQLALLLRALNKGYSILSVNTPDRCDHHKGLRSEAVLATGAVYLLTELLMDYGLEATIGTPPILCHWVLEQFLLLAHIQWAAYQDIEYVEYQEATLLIDPFDLYQRFFRFELNAQIAGHLSEFPKLIRMDPNAPPLMTEEQAFYYATLFFNRGLMPSPQELYGLEYDVIQVLKKCFIPYLLQEENNFTKEPVISSYWADFHRQLSDKVTLIRSFQGTTWDEVLKRIPSAVVGYGIEKVFGVPMKQIKKIHQLAQKPYFRAFLNALDGWLKRNGPAYGQVIDVVSIEGGDFIDLFSGISDSQAGPSEDKREQLSPEDLEPSDERPVLRLGDETLKDPEADMKANQQEELSEDDLQTPRKDEKDSPVQELLFESNSESEDWAEDLNASDLETEEDERSSLLALSLFANRERFGGGSHLRVERYSSADLK